MEDPAGASPPGCRRSRSRPASSWSGFQDLIYGTALDLFDGRPNTVGHAVLRGALFATLMSIVSLTVLRRRTQRQSQRPIG